jgi:hypothetical protein
MGIVLMPRLPIELHVKCKQYRSTIGLPPNVVSDPNWNSKVEQEENHTTSWRNGKVSLIGTTALAKRAITEHPSNKAESE